MSFEDEIEDFDGSEYSEFLGRRGRGKGKGRFAAKFAERRAARQARRGGDAAEGEYDTAGGGSFRERLKARAAKRGGGRRRFGRRRR